MQESKSSKKRVSAILSLIAIIMIAVVWGSEHWRSRAEGRNLANQSPTVNVESIVPHSLVRRLSVESELQPFQEVDVHAKVAGYVKAIYVDIGSHVHAGQLMAVLSVPELEHQREEVAADLVRREHELSRAQSEYDDLHLAYTRLQQVSGSGQNLVAQQELDDAAAKDRAAQAGVSAAQAALVSARAKDAEISTLVSYTRITAPFAGIVSKRFAHVGTMLPAGTATSTQALPLVHLTQNNPLRLVIPVPESAAPYVHDGTPVEIRIPAISRDFKSSVTRVAGELDATTRTLRAEVDLPNPRLDLTPGEYADADIALQRKSNAITVPVEALITQDGRASLLVVTSDNKIERRQVTVGTETSHEVEVTSGLRAGERVVVPADPELKAGERVTPRMVAPQPAEEER